LNRPAGSCETFARQQGLLLKLAGKGGRERSGGTCYPVFDVRRYRLGPALCGHCATDRMVAV